MSAGSIVSAVITFVLVLGLMGLALRLLRKYTVGATTRDSAIPMEVVQRLTLGQRQGIAVVRVAGRTFIVSMGDGGVRLLAELDSPEHSTERMYDTYNERHTNVVASHAPSKRKHIAPSNRISYVAPIEDFRAVLSMAMSEPAHS